MWKNSDWGGVRDRVSCTCVGVESTKAITIMRQNKRNWYIWDLSVGHDLIRASFNSPSFAWMTKDNSQKLWEF